jgi:WD40 repeat protein
LSCVQSLEHPRSVRDTKFTENGDIVTACSDGLVRIWTPDQNHFASQEELESKLKKRKLNDVIPLTSVILFR